MLVGLVAFVSAFALGLGATRLRSVAGLAALVIAAYAGAAADPRAALVATAMPITLAILAADAVRLGRRLPVVRLAAEDRRRPVELLSEHHPRELVRQGQ